MWRTVESDFIDNIDVASADHFNRCIQYTPELCDVLDDPDFTCGPAGARPPTVPAPAVSSPSPGSIKVDWDDPMSCEPAIPDYCTLAIGCPTGQYCKIDDPNGDDGHCYYTDPVTCTDPSDCQAGEACQSRVNEIAGYYIYVGESNSAGHHFRKGMPVATTLTSKTEHIFENLAPVISGTTPNNFSFRIATFDAGGEISKPSPSSNLIAPSGSASLAAPGSLQTVIWNTTDPLFGTDAIKVKWLPGESYIGLTGYRVWRSTVKGGPYCALILESDPSALVCKDAASLGTSEVSTTDTYTSFIDGSVALDVTYYYAVKAVITGGVESPYSNEIKSLALPFDAQRPSVPEGFRAEAPRGLAQHSGSSEYAGIYLRWCRNPEVEGVTGYEVYRSGQTMGPYTLMVEAPPICMDGHHRCEIEETSPGSGVFTLTAPSTDCQPGSAGTCQVIDTTVMQATLQNPPQPQNQPVYYYVVKAVRDEGGGVIRESAYTQENQGRPNYNDVNGWGLVFDPDNYGLIPCGDEVSALDAESVTLVDSSLTSSEEGPTCSEMDAGNTLAPYRVIGQITGPPTPSADPRFLYFHLDHLGSPRAITDAGGNLVSKHHYMPFGEEKPTSSQESSNTRQFTGHERDSETGGMDYMLARYYGSWLGRFVSPDPAPPHMIFPQTYNRYIYAGNNPIRYVDPDGRDFYLKCSDLGTATCDKNGHAGTTDENGKFTATIISNNKDGDLVDQDGNKYTAEVDSDGVHFQKQGSTKKSTGVWQRGSNAVSFTQDSGALKDFGFSFPKRNPNSGQDSRGKWTFDGSREAAEKALEDAGLVEDGFSIRPGADWRSPSDNKHNATHFNFDGKTRGNFHTGETNRGVKGHGSQAGRNALESMRLVPPRGGDE